jgi:putative transposase
MADWPHAPAHRLEQPGAFMVTAGTYRKEHLFNSPERLNMLRNLLFDLAEQHQWKLQAWALMSNHYHFISLSPGGPETLQPFIRKLHSLSARELNRLDHAPGRKVWFQYWDSHLTFEKSYFARLNYVHQNPVHHQLVPLADQYEWCSAKWFELNAGHAFRKTVYSFKTDRVKVIDDF